MVVRNSKLALARVATNKTQKETAEALGMSLCHYNNVERKAKNPSLKMAMKMSEYFGMSVNELFEGELIDENRKGEK